MFEKSIFSVVATPASSILIRFSKQPKKTLCPVTVLVDSQVSDCCPWATCFQNFITIINYEKHLEKTITLVLKSLTKILIICSILQIMSENNLDGAFCKFNNKIFAAHFKTF